MRSPFYPGNVIDNLDTWSARAYSLSKILSQMFWHERHGQADVLQAWGEGLADAIADYVEAIQIAVNMLPMDAGTEFELVAKSDRLKAFLKDEEKQFKAALGADNRKDKAA